MALPVIDPDITPASLVAKHPRRLNLSPLARARRLADDLEERVPLLAVARVGPAAGGLGDVALGPAFFGLVWYVPVLKCGGW